MLPTTATEDRNDALELDLFSSSGSITANYEDAVARQRLFAQKSTIQTWKIDATEYCASGLNHKTAVLDSDVEKHLVQACRADQQNCTQLFMVGKRTSRAPLQISAASFASFAQKINAFPSLAKALSAFESDNSDRYITLSGAFFNTPLRTPCWETCILFGYVERSKLVPLSTTLPADEDFLESQSWSLRQMAIYQKLQIDQNFETSLLVYPSSDVRTAMNSSFQDRTNGIQPYEHWTITMSMVLGSITANWPALLAALHRAVETLKSDASFTDPKRKRINEVDSETLEKCATLADKLRSTCHVLDNNILVLHALLAESTKRERQDVVSNGARYSVFAGGVEGVVREFQIHRNHAVFLTGRLEHTTSQVRDLVSLRNSFTMEKMTVRSISEARAVRLIALVTLFFLPPTFTSGFLEMNYIQVSLQSGRLSVDGQPGLLFYLAITLPLMALTIGGWLFWDWQRVKEAQKHDEEQGYRL